MSNTRLYEMLSPYVVSTRANFVVFVCSIISRYMGNDVSLIWLCLVLVKALLWLSKRCTWVPVRGWELLEAQLNNFTSGKFTNRVHKHGRFLILAFYQDTFPLSTQTNITCELHAIHKWSKIHIALQSQCFCLISYVDTFYQENST